MKKYLWRCIQFAYMNYANYSLSFLAVVYRITLLGCGGAVGHVREVCCVSTLFQGVFVALFGFVESVFVA